MINSASDKTAAEVSEGEDYWETSEVIGSTPMTPALVTLENDPSPVPETFNLQFENGQMRIEPLNIEVIAEDLDLTYGDYIDINHYFLLVGENEQRFKITDDGNQDYNYTVYPNLAAPPEVTE